MRILHLLNGLHIGGKERIALRLARTARVSGFDVRIVLFDTPFRDPEIDFDPGDLSVQFVPRRGGVDRQFIRALTRRLRDDRIDVIHAHNDTAVFYACAAAWLGRRKRLVVCGTFHTLPVHDTCGARFLTRLASRRADRVTAVSDELARRLLDAGWVTNCRTLWNGVDLQEFSPGPATAGWRQRLGIAEDAVVVGHIARFDPIKRHFDLLEAAERIGGQNSNVHFVLVGRGPIRDDVIAAAGRLRNVHFVPTVRAVAPFLRELDVFVLCSAHECAPCVVLEAMATALPVVSTDVGGVPYLLDGAPGGAVGVMTPAARPDLLATAIARLASDPTERRALGVAARRRARDFSAEAEWRQYCRLYEAAASGRGHRARFAQAESSPGDAGP